MQRPDRRQLIEDSVPEEGSAGSPSGRPSGPQAPLCPSLEQFARAPLWSEGSHVEGFEEAGRTGADASLEKNELFFLLFVLHLFGQGISC